MNVDQCADVSSERISRRLQLAELDSNTPLQPFSAAPRCIRPGVESSGFVAFALALSRASPHR